MGKREIKTPVTQGAKNKTKAKEGREKSSVPPSTQGSKNDQHRTNMKVPPIFLVKGHPKKQTNILGVLLIIP